MDSLFDILGEAFSIHNDRAEQHRQNMIIQPLFVKSKIKRNLDTGQKMLVFQLMTNLNNSIDVKPIIETIY
jgi:hypothetical protein